MRYKYDYLEEIKKDVKTWIDENIDYIGEDIKEGKDDLCDYLNDELFNNDSITGNASGSYFMNIWKAEEALCHNLDLLGEALEMFGDEGTNILKNGAEWCDVTIRCYLLGSAIAEVLKELENDGFFEKRKKSLYKVYAQCCTRAKGRAILKVGEDIESIEDVYDYIGDELTDVTNAVVEGVDEDLLIKKAGFENPAEIIERLEDLDKLDAFYVKLYELTYEEICKQVEHAYNMDFNILLECGDYYITYCTLEDTYRPGAGNYPHVFLDEFNWNTFINDLLNVQPS